MQQTTATIYPTLSNHILPWLDGFSFLLLLCIVLQEQVASLLHFVPSFRSRRRTDVITLSLLYGRVKVLNQRTGLFFNLVPRLRGLLATS